MSVSIDQLIKSFIPHVYHKIQQYRLNKRLPNRYHSKTPITFIMKDRQAGFFSHFFQVLGAVDFCRNHGNNLMLDFCNGPYVDKDKGDNWWTYYFESDRFLFVQPCYDKSEIIVEEQGHFAGYGHSLPFKIGYQLISDLGIRPKKEINYIVSNFIDQNFRGQHIVGIHYRGTDKSIEAPRVPYEYVLNHLEKYSDCLFFVATDETQFLEDVIKHFGKRVLYYDAIRSTNGQPVHLSGNVSSNYRAGKDALIDCLLLSNCNVLVRTESNLSHASSFFNPYLRVVTLTFPKPKSSS